MHVVVPVGYRRNPHCVWRMDPRADSYNGVSDRNQNLISMKQKKKAQGHTCSSSLFLGWISLCFYLLPAMFKSDNNVQRMFKCRYWQTRRPLSGFKWTRCTPPDCTTKAFGWWQAEVYFRCMKDERKGWKSEHLVLCSSGAAKRLEHTGDTKLCFSGIGFVVTCMAARTVCWPSHFTVTSTQSPPRPETVNMAVGVETWE